VCVCVKVTVELENYQTPRVIIPYKCIRI